MWRTLVIALALLSTAAAQAERPQRPSMIFPPSVARVQESIILQVSIEPNPDIRTVLGEILE
ncbi:MAG: hypothetical protein HY701_12740, partial [Gemmatimonadetes bacterium]|nr:hypothetical protein [Gemmatimonadota bacterium]